MVPSVLPSLSDRAVIVNKVGIDAIRLHITITALSDREGRTLGTFDLSSVFLNCKMRKDNEDVIMRLDKFMKMIPHMI